MCFVQDGIYWSCVYDLSLPWKSWKFMYAGTALAIPLCAVMHRKSRLAAVCVDSTRSPRALLYLELR